METVQGGVTAPMGFSAFGIFCGIKRRGKDMALLVSDRPAAVAGMLTTNRLSAPCVDWVRTVLKKGRAQAIVANSGNANCCTGRQGHQDCGMMARWVAERLQIPQKEVLVASTGVIGQFLPMQKVRSGIQLAVRRLSRTGSISAAEAIMTTDTRPKEIAIRFTVGRSLVTVGGIAKGSGMISPHMATMLAFLTTDARIQSGSLRRALQLFVPESFNAMTVDGAMSTNDMVLFLANGASGCHTLQEGTEGYRKFLKAVEKVCSTLAHEIVRDGEGVTRLFTVQVTGASNSLEAMRVARQVANCVLVKTMVAGRDPNWGRIAAAVGASGIPIRPRQLTLRLGKVTVFQGGEPVKVPRPMLLQQVDHPEVRIEIKLGRGTSQARLLSGDLTEDYVRINAKYTT